MNGRMDEFSPSVSLFHLVLCCNHKLDIKAHHLICGLGFIILAILRRGSKAEIHYTKFWLMKKQETRKLKTHFIILIL